MMFVIPKRDPFIVISAETVLHREPGYGCKYVVLIKEGLYRIQILCRRHPFWSYPAGLTIADLRVNKS